MVRARKNVTDFLGLTDHYTDYKRNERIINAIIKERELENDPPGLAHILPDGTIGYGEQPLIPLEYELMGYTPVGDVQTFAVDVPEAYKRGGVKAALKMAGLGLIGFIPGIGDAASKIGKKYAVRHGVPKKVVEQSIKKGAMNAVAPSIALTNPERFYGFGYAGRDGVTFLGDNTLLKNAELYIGDASTPTVPRVIEHYKLPEDIPQEELLEYMKKYADEVHRANNSTVSEKFLREYAMNGFFPYNEAKVYENIPYNKFKAAITDYRNTDIIRALSDEGLEIFPIYPEFHSTERALSEEVNWLVNNFYYDHPEYLFSKGGGLLMRRKKPKIFA